MKKFISWVATVAVLVSVMSCREAEDLTTVPETNYHANAKLKNDSLDEKTEDSSSNTSNTASEEEGDPPKKDEIKW